MTEAEWLTCKDAWKMLTFLRFRLSQRKLHLYACACCRVLWPEMQDPRSRQAVEVAEQYADGLVSAQDLLAAHGDAEEALRALQADFPEVCRRWREAAEPGPGSASGVVPPGTALMAADAVRMLTYPTLFDPTEEPELSLVCSIHGIIGEARSNAWIPLDGPLRDIVGNPYRAVPRLHPGWLLWGDAAVPRLAQSIYDDRRFADLPLLADALADAGGASAELLNHLRSPGPHVLGCWALDLILSKDR